MVQHLAGCGGTELNCLAQQLGPYEEIGRVFVLSANPFGIGITPEHSPDSQCVCNVQSDEEYQGARIC